jgi:hypothetical protein
MKARRRLPESLQVIVKVKQFAVVCPCVIKHRVSPLQAEVVGGQARLGGVTDRSVNETDLLHRSTSPWLGNVFEGIERCSKKV